MIAPGMHQGELKIWTTNLLRRYGFQIKDFLQNLFGDGNSDEIEEELSNEENAQELYEENQEEIEQVFDVIAEILEQ